MKKFEYQVITKAKLELNIYREVEFKNYLNEMGQEGWELITFKDIDNGGVIPIYRLVFKREIVE